MSSGFVIERPLIPVSSSTSRRAVLSMVSLDSAFPFGKSHLPLRKINKIQSDIHLYEDYINSIQYLEEFDEIFPAKQLGAITQDIIDDIKETH